MLDTRYSKEQLLDLFKEQRDAGDLADGASDLYLGEVDPESGGGSLSRWNRREDYGQENAPGLEICLNRSGDTEPLELHEMSPEEKEVCAERYQVELRTSTNMFLRSAFRPLSILP